LLLLRRLGTTVDTEDGEIWSQTRRHTNSRQRILVDEHVVLAAA
jgi:hypothetical protein